MITTLLLRASPKFMRREAPYLWRIQSIDYLHYGDAKNSADTAPMPISFSGNGHGTHGIAYYRDLGNAEKREPENLFALPDPNMAAIIHLTMPDGTAVNMNHLGYTRVVSGKSLENWGFGDRDTRTPDQMHIPVPASPD